jgi:hypothetical protein
MKSSSSTASIGRERWVRIIALFLLVYSFGDIFLPQYFCEEEIGLFASGSGISCVQNIKDATAEQMVISPPSDEKQKSGAIPGDDDCFCRSSVLPSLSQSARLAAAPDIASQAVNAGNSFLQTPPLSGATTVIPSPPRSFTSPPHLSQIIRC